MVEIKYNTMQNLIKFYDNEEIKIDMFGNLILRGDKNIITIAPSNKLYLNLTLIGNNNYVVVKLEKDFEFNLNLVIEGNRNTIIGNKSNIIIVGEKNKIEINNSSCYMEGDNTIDYSNTSNIMSKGNIYLDNVFFSNILSNCYKFHEIDKLEIDEIQNSNIFTSDNVISDIKVANKVNLILNKSSVGIVTKSNIYSTKIESEMIEYSNFIGDADIIKTLYNNNMKLININKTNIGTAKYNLISFLVQFSNEKELLIDKSEYNIIDFLSQNNYQYKLGFNNVLKTYLIDKNEIIEAEDITYKFTNDKLFNEKDSPEIFI